MRVNVCTILAVLLWTATQAVTAVAPALETASIRTITVEDAKRLSQDRSGTLLLDGLTTLSPEAARELAKYDGWLSLNGLKEISDEAAVALGQHKGVLHLNGLTKVSDGAANALAGHRGAAGVYLCGDHLWSASIEGAIISGLRAADAILKPS